MKIDTVKERINSIKSAYPMYDELLTFYEKIVTRQEEFKQHLQTKASLPAVEASKAKQKIEACIPLLEDEEWELDFPSTSQLFDGLCDIAKAQNDKLKSAVQKIERTVKESNVDLKSKSFILREDLFRKVAHSELDYIDKISNNFSLNKSVLTLLTLNSVKPSIELIAHRLQESVNLEPWSGISCPICGSPPAISELHGEEGRRILFCSFCSTQWQGRRIICYHCGATENQTLRYFYIEAEERYRIDVCDKCKHYLKTLDSRKSEGEIVPAVEALATLHLDILAEGEGYQSVASTARANFQMNEAC